MVSRPIRVAALSRKNVHTAIGDTKRSNVDHVGRSTEGSEASLPRATTSRGDASSGHQRGVLKLSSQSGLSFQQLKLDFTSFQPVEHVLAVINGRSVVLELHLVLRQDGAQSTAFLPSQITMKAVVRP